MGGRDPLKIDVFQSYRILLDLLSNKLVYIGIFLEHER